MGRLKILMALIFCALETKYFGGNWTPQSNAELLADGFSVLIAVVGLAVMSFENRNKKC